MRLLRRPLLSIALLVIVAAGLTGCVHGTQPSAKAPTALDTYVHAPDPHYSFKLANTLKGDGYTAYVLSMTSQQFRTEKEVNRPIWTHWLTIVKPDKVVTDKGLLVISGGSVDKPVPDKVDGLLAGIAVSTHSVVTQLQGIPNEPLVFAGETRSRTEDGIIAYTWDKFLRTGDSTWPLRLPMTKAAVRAMDTVTAFMGSEPGREDRREAVCRYGRLQARLDHMDDRRRGQARDRHRAHRYQHAQYRTVVPPPLPCVWTLGAGRG